MRCHVKNSRAPPRVGAARPPGNLLKSGPARRGVPGRATGQRLCSPEGTARNKKARILVESGPRHEFEMEGVRLCASLARWQSILVNPATVGSQARKGRLPLLHRGGQRGHAKTSTHDRTPARKGQCAMVDVLGHGHDEGSGNVGLKSVGCGRCGYNEARTVKTLHFCVKRSNNEMLFWRRRFIRWCKPHPSSSHAFAGTCAAGPHR